MSSFIWAYILVAWSFHGEFVHKDSITLCYSRFVGSVYCNACTTYERCAHCNNGGSCGVCSESGRESRNNNVKGRSQWNAGSTLVTPKTENRLYFAVTSGKAYFYNSPNHDTQRKAYLIRGETGKIKINNGVFIYTEFQNAMGVLTKGWIRLSDVKVLWVFLYCRSLIDKRITPIVKVLEFWRIMSLTALLAGRRRQFTGPGAVWSLRT